MHPESYEEEAIETYAVTDSNIVSKVSSFLGVPIVIVFGWLKNKYMSIFSVEHDKHRLVVIYQGICPVIRNDRLRHRCDGIWRKARHIRNGDARL